MIRGKLSLGASLAAALLALPGAAQAAWEPTKPVEFVVPAGTGGGAGAEGFLAVKEAKGDPHKIIITLSNLFTTPLATGVPFNWKDMTPVSMMALDQFVLWVNADSPYKTASQFLTAVKAAGPNKMKMGGTGSKQEDQILTVGMEKATGTKFIYIPYKGGGEVAVQLVGGHVDATVNNPIEAVAQWRAGKLRPLCVFDDKRMPYKEKVTDKESWGDIATCKEAGVPTDYVMLRGIFMAPGVTADQTAYFVELMKKVRETPDWKEFMEKGAFNTTAMTGTDYVKWLTSADIQHRLLMTEAGFLAKP